MDVSLGRFIKDDSKYIENGIIKDLPLWGRLKTVFQNYRKDRIYNSIEELQELFDDLIQCGSINKNSSKRRFPIYWRSEIRWVILHFDGCENTNEYQVSETASAYPVERIESQQSVQPIIEIDMEKLNSSRGRIGSYGYTKNELLTFCQQKNLKNYKSLKKNDLVDLLLQ